MNSSTKMLILGLTGQCNFACTYCYASAQPRQKMERSTAKQAVDIAAAGGNAFVLQMSGGEPLLAFDVVADIAEYVKGKHMLATLQLQTNASLITPEKAAFIKQAGISVGISLDGRPQENDYCRKLLDGGGTSHLIAQGMQTLAEAGVETGITCVVTAHNVRRLQGIVEMAYYFGNVRKIGFDLLRAQGHGRGVAAADARELQSALRGVLARAKQLESLTGKRIVFSHGERIKKLAARRTESFAHCHAMNGEAAYVDPDGSLYACASLAGFPAFRIGTVETGIDFPRQRMIAQQIRADMQFCTDCPSFLLCGGSCFARWFGAGDHSRPYHPECVLKEAFIEAYKNN